MVMRAQQLIERPLDKKHVVLLGAGASRAAFGRCLLLMDDLIDVLHSVPLLAEAGIETRGEKNFEVIYSQLISNPKYANTVVAVEHLIRDYFSGLSLPESATIYDRILLSTRPIDAIFTFNWDPFLFDAYRRNYGVVRLPEIFFLHGNVRIGRCPNLLHGQWGPRNAICPDYSEMFVDVPLLYPIKRKNYSFDPYIHEAWNNAKIFFRDAFTLTIFGYGAPVSDVDAVDLLRGAWIDDKHQRIFEHIEIIDITSSSILSERWAPFTPTLHHHFTTAFEQSRIARWPRRVCESTFYPMTSGLPCEDFPLPSTESIGELQAYVANIARREPKP